LLLLLKQLEKPGHKQNSKLPILDVNWQKELIVLERQVLKHSFLLLVVHHP